MAWIDPATVAQKRDAAGLKAGHVAAAIGVTPITLSRAENGATHSPGVLRDALAYIEAVAAAQASAILAIRAGRA